MTTRSTLSPALGFLLVSAAVVIVVAGMRASAPLVTPFLLAILALRKDR